MKNNRASAIFYEMQKSHGFGFADGYGQIPLKSCKRFCNFFSAKGDEFVVGIDEKCFNQKIILIYFSTEGNEESLIGVIHLGDGNDPIEFFKNNRVSDKKGFALTLQNLFLFLSPPLVFFTKIHSFLLLDRHDQ